MARNLTRFSPFNDIARFSPFSGLEDFMRDFATVPSWSGKESPQLIRMDVSEDETAYRVEAEIPGCRKEDIKISVEGNTVSISAETKSEKEEKQEGNVVRSERYFGQMYRSFSLPVNIDDEKVQASYQDGVLKLTLPKKTTAGTRQIQVQ